MLGKSENRFRPVKSASAKTASAKTASAKTASVAPYYRAVYGFPIPVECRMRNAEVAECGMPNAGMPECYF